MMKERKIGLVGKLLIGLLVIAVVLVVTCPSEASHRERLEDLFSNAVRQAVEAELPDDVKRGGDTRAMEGLRQSLNASFSRSLEVDNYLLFSLASVKMGEFSQTLSVGILGMIFSPDEGDIRQLLRGKVGMPHGPAKPGDIEGVLPDTTTIDYDKPLDIPPIPGEMGPGGPGGPDDGMGPGGPDDEMGPGGPDDEMGHEPPSMSDAQSEFWDDEPAE